MLDRRGILRTLSALGFPQADYWLTAGGAMVLHGAKDVTADIDLGVTTALADALILGGAPWSPMPGGGRRIALTDGIELFENWGGGPVENICGVPTLSLDGIIRLKENLGRPKDARDIALLRAHRDPNATRVYFVRHAQPNYENHDDLTRELTEKGLADRHLAAAFLLDKGIAAVFSSPYKRAVDTVRPLADALGLPIQVADGFRERKVARGWIEDMADFTRRQWADFDYRRPEGESLAEVRSRNLAALDDVRRRFPGKALAVGAHGTALSTIISHYDPSFGYEKFMELQPLMPWIEKFTFRGDDCVATERIDLFKIEGEAPGR